ncbi:hypothetical protein TNCV_920791 [Trichonephila clavipes]|nr:hypothetical protein TNCV_920791 [Trichonephila clavipes]
MKTSSRLSPNKNAPTIALEAKPELICKGNSPPLVTKGVMVYSGKESVILKSLCLSVSLHNICLFAHKNNFIRFSNLVQSRQPETMTRRKGLSPDEISNLLLEFSENESNNG